MNVISSCWSGKSKYLYDIKSNRLTYTYFLYAIRFTDTRWRIGRIIEQSGKKTEMSKKKSNELYSILGYVCVCIYSMMMAHHWWIKKREEEKKNTKFEVIINELIKFSTIHLKCISYMRISRKIYLFGLIFHTCSNVFGYILLCFAWLCRF